MEGIAWIRPEVIAAMRKAAETSPFDAIRVLATREENLTQFQAIVYLSKAFPSIPLRVWSEASASRLIVGDPGFSDDHISKLLTGAFADRHE